MSIHQLIDDKPELKEVLEGILEAEKSDTPVRDAWTVNEIDNCHGWELGLLEKEGIIEPVQKSSSNPNLYCLVDTEEVETALEEIDQTFDSSGGEECRVVDPPSFDAVVGLDEVKFIVQKALTAGERVNVLLHGPPSVAKSVILMEIEESVPNAEYGYGSQDTAAGLIELLFERTPQVLLIDELDEMSKEDYSVLEQLCEHGRVTERKYGKTREIKLDTRSIAACNELESIPAPVRSRFQTMKIDSYDEDEFIKVVTGVLIQKEDRDEEMAERIAERVYHEYDSKDVRDAIRISRMADDEEELDKVVSALKKHRVE